MLFVLNWLATGAFLRSHLELDVLDTLDTFQYFVKLLFFLVIKASNFAFFCLLQLLVLENALFSLSVCFEQIKALLGHFIVYAIYFTGPRFFIVLNMNSKHGQV